jgi:NAD(P)H-hydrate epimerase
MRLVTAEQMRAIDRETIDNEGISGPELMENAGRGIASEIFYDHIEEGEQTRVIVVCGKGNNGGDGFVVARYVQEAEVSVEVYFLGPAEGLSDDAALNYRRASELGIRITEIKAAANLPDPANCDIVVDAVFGTGFEAAPRGTAKDVIEWINRQDAEIIAVDIPSGLNADNGQHEGAVVEADSTYTLALPKYGLYISPGRELSGVTTTVPIGVPDSVMGKADLSVELIDPEYVADLLPLRRPDAHKGDFGKLFIVAGSTGLTGAAVMAGESAARSGAGLVKVGCPRTVLPIIATKLTEVMTYPLPDVARKGAFALRGLGEIRAQLDKNDALILGPGLGTHRETVRLVRGIIGKLSVPTIVDADGLNALEGEMELISQCKAPLVLTPHPGEFKRLIGEMPPPESEIHDRIELVRQASLDLGVVMVLKGSPTLVAEPGGLCYVNQTGNEGMASGGSGDVLSGIIGSFLAQGMTAVEAAVAGVFVHGLAGDLAAQHMTTRAMIAGDIIQLLPEAFALLAEQ